MIKKKVPGNNREYYRSTLEKYVVEYVIKNIQGDITHEKVLYVFRLTQNTIYRYLYSKKHDNKFTLNFGKYLKFSMNRDRISNMLGYLNTLDNKKFKVLEKFYYYYIFQLKKINDEKRRSTDKFNK